MERAVRPNKKPIIVGSKVQTRSNQAALDQPPTSGPTAVVPVGDESLTESSLNRVQSPAPLAPTWVRRRRTCDCRGCELT